VKTTEGIHRRERNERRNGRGDETIGNTDAPAPLLEAYRSDRVLNQDRRRLALHPGQRLHYTGRHPPKTIINSSVPVQLIKHMSTHATAVRYLSLRMPTVSLLPRLAVTASNTARKIHVTHPKVKANASRTSQYLCHSILFCRLANPMRKAEATIFARKSAPHVFPVIRLTSSELLLLFGSPVLVVSIYDTMTTWTHIVMRPIHEVG